MSKKLLALLLALIMIVGSFTSVLADGEKPAAKEPAEKTEEKAEKKDEKAKTEEKKDEKSEEKKDEKSEEKTEEKKEEEPAKTNDEALDRAIEVLKKAGFISGYSADSEDFRTDRNVKRSEFASMIVRAMNLEESAKALANIPTGFKDVPSNHWANGYIAVAKQQGFINGYPDGTFRPDRQISYQDMATMLTIALKQNTPGDVYPAGYIVKAQSLGLFQNVKPLAYTDMATRGDVFKMLYNMITSKEFGQRKIVKAIVLENSRVEKMAADEVVVEVIKVVQEANWVNANRTKRGDQYKYKLSKDLKLDVEDLLGKVIDLTTNEKDEIVEVKVDKTYDYVDGAITNVDYKKFGLENKNYTALFDERYAGEDERIFRTYLNDKDFKYEDFAKNYKEGKYDFARATIKNGKVIFIDAYQFNDIAPVAEVKDGDVYYYDDKDSARVKKAIDLMPRVIISTNGVYTVGDKKMVAADDVIHFYAGYRKAIVKKNAKTEQVLVETKRDRNGDEYLVLEDKSEPWLNYVTPFRAVYSYEGKEFRVAITRGNFEPILKRKVKVLTALDGSVQLVQSDLAWDDGIQAIKKITSYGEVNLLASKGAEIWSKEGRDTSYYDLRVNNRALVDKFEKNDIVFYRGEGEEGKDKVTKAMYLLFKKHDGTKENKTGYSGQFKSATINGRYINVTAAADSVSARNRGYYRHFDNLNAYIYDKKGNLQPIPDMAKFIEYNGTFGNVCKNPDLQAFVVSELELRNMLRGYDVNPFNFLSNDKAADEVARVVVFAQANGAGKKYADFYAEVIEKYDYTDRVLFRDAAGKEWLVKVEKDGEEIYKEGDIVKLYVDKATLEKDIKEGYVNLAEPRLQNLAALNREPVEGLNKWSKPYAIKAIQYRRTYKIDVDGNGKFNDPEDEVIFINDDTAIFNDSNFGWVQLARNVDYNTDAPKGFIDVMRFVQGPYVERPTVAADGLLDAMNTDKANQYEGYLVMSDLNGKARFEKLSADVRLVKGNSVPALGAKNVFAELAKMANGHKAYHESEIEIKVEKGLVTEVKIVRTKDERCQEHLDALQALVNKEGLKKIYDFAKKNYAFADYEAIVKADYVAAVKELAKLVNADIAKEFSKGVKDYFTLNEEITVDDAKFKFTPGTNVDVDGKGTISVEAMSGYVADDIEYKIDLVCNKEHADALNKKLAGLDLRVDLKDGATEQEIKDAIEKDLDAKLPKQANVTYECKVDGSGNLEYKDATHGKLDVTITVNGPIGAKATFTVTYTVNMVHPGA